MGDNVRGVIEDAPIETGRFDIIHSCHTIEHLAEPKHVLADHWRTLKPGGLLLVAQLVCGEQVVVDFSDVEGA